MSYVLFKRTDLRPEGVDRTRSSVCTSLNAVAIVTGRPWQELVKCLIDQAHIRAYMPDYSVCITDMLRAVGFQNLGMQVWTDNVYEKLGEYTAKGCRFIVRINGSGYFALVPESDGEYVIRGLSGENERVLQRLKEVWLYVPGTDNRSGIRKPVSEKKLVDSSEKLNVINLNPEGRCIPDCVLRGLSAAYGCSWHEAMDLLAKSVNYTNPQINSVPVINQTLTMLGFERHKRLYQGRKLLSGKEFCDFLSRKYKNGERIFLFVGNTHCAAALPFTDGEGKTVYKIQDTWDSTDRKIYDYWVYSEKKKEEENEPEKPAVSVEEGYLIRHPYYGKGRIVSINGENLEVNFEKQGTKTFLKKWVVEKCGIVAV